MPTAVRGLIAGLAISLSALTWPALAADQATIEAAKKEGSVSYATNLLAPISQKALEAAFKKHYGLPDTFKVEAYTPSSSQVISRALQEIEAKNVKIDWISLNVPTFWLDLQKRGEILEYCSPEYKKLDLKDKVGIVEGGCFFQPTATVSFGLIWNPKFVKEDLQTWAQLVDPKYKGLVIMGDARKVAPYLDTYIGLRDAGVWSPEWLQKIKAHEPFFDTRSTAIRDKVLTGEFPIAIMGYGPRAYQVRDKAELKASYPTDGIVVGGHYGGILKQAPNPNAAKLLVDYVFSKEGQEFLIQEEGIASMRSDAKPSAEVAPFVPDLSKSKAVHIDWANLSDEKREKAREEFRSLFGN